MSVPIYCLGSQNWFGSVPGRILFASPHCITHCVLLISGYFSNDLIDLDKLGLFPLNGVCISLRWESCHPGLLGFRPHFLVRFLRPSPVVVPLVLLLSFPLRVGNPRRIYLLSSAIRRLSRRFFGGFFCFLFGLEGTQICLCAFILNFRRIVPGREISNRLSTNLRVSGLFLRLRIISMISAVAPQ